MELGGNQKRWMTVTGTTKARWPGTNTSEVIWPVKIIQKKKLLMVLSLLCEIWYPNFFRRSLLEQNGYSESRQISKEETTI